MVPATPRNEAAAAADTAARVAAATWVTLTSILGPLPAIPSFRFAPSLKRTRARGAVVPGGGRVWFRTRASGDGRAGNAGEDLAGDRTRRLAVNVHDEVGNLLVVRLPRRRQLLDRGGRIRLQPRPALAAAHPPGQRLVARPPPD